MQREQIRDLLQEILEEETGEVAIDLPDETRLTERFRLDSVDIVSLVMQVERRFGIRLRQDDLSAVDTLASLIDLVDGRIEGFAAVEA